MGIVIAFSLMFGAPAAILPVKLQEDQPSINCSHLYPGATYEELVFLCAEDNPPDGHNSNDLIPPGGRTPDCNSAGSRLCKQPE